MKQSAYEPTRLEVGLTVGFGLTFLNPYYRAFVESLNFYGHERVIDFGSGSGSGLCSRHIAARLQQGGGHLDCVDISGGWNRVMHRMLWRFRNVEIHQGDIADLPLPDDTYDAVVVHFVLHDIPRKERGRFVAALADKLKPAGRLLLREPAGDGLVKNELKALADASDLHIASLQEHNVAIGPVLDGNFIDIQPRRTSAVPKQDSLLEASLAY